MFEIRIKLTTVSCCLVGNQTESFSIGGVDQSTTIDENGKPIIHGSAFKGAFRNIVREREKRNKELTQIKDYVKHLTEETLKKYKSKDIQKTEKIEKMLLNLEEKARNPKAEYIFGMEGVNGMPRLFCSDFRVSKSEDKQKDGYFLIDTKNNLEEKYGEILSNPRTYRVIKPGVEFEGTVRFYNQLEESKEIETTIKEELEEVLKEFNNGLYGIGNSKSRGYGQVKVEIIDYDKKG